MNRNLFFLMIALLGVFCFILAGIFIAERNPIGLVLSLLAAVGIIGVGFMFKKKWREAGE